MIPFEAHPTEAPLKVIAVIGSGTMGNGIAQVAAQAGWSVALCDANPEALQKGLGTIRKSLERLAEKGKLAEAPPTIWDRIRPVATIEAAAANADLAIEAVPESLELKRKIFAALDGSAPAHAVLASNTSSISIASIAEGTARRDRVVGMHFFNPVPVMALIEVVRGKETSDETVAFAVEVGRAMGKEPIVVKDLPGFATSRLGVLLGLEAMRMLEQGVASASDIDKAMTLGYRHPMGPLQLTDLVGLDVRLAIAEHLHRELASEAFRPPEILRRRVAEGNLGKKSGRGFYTWDGDKAS